MNNDLLHIGVVEDIMDPKKDNRVKVRIFGVHNPNKNILPTEDLPWAKVNMPVTSANISGIGQSVHGLVNGSWCLVLFLDPYSKQLPLIIGTLNGFPTDIIEYDEFLKDSRKYDSENNKGFVDPDKKYPLYLNESDVNRLSRNEKIDQTIVQKKKDGIIKNIPVANEENTWSEPETAYDAKYPYNKVLETPSGHIVEYDDTPEKERIHHYHKSGTFQEIYPDGQKVEKVVKDNYQILLNDDYIYVEGNVKIYIKNNANIYVEGNVNNQITGNCENQVLGNCNTYVKGDYNLGVEGDFNISTGGKLECISDSTNITSSQTTNIKGSYVNIN